MLYFVTGRIGAGKTTYIHELIDQFADNGRRDMTLIVPEQYSFATEKAMVDRMGAAKYPAVSVLSFSRLAERLVPQSALTDKKPVDDASRAAVMSLALRDVCDKLEIYGKQADNPAVINSFLSVYDELRQSCITADMLSQAAAEMDECQLKRKLLDITLALTAFEAESSRRWYSKADLTEMLCAELEKSHYFKGKLVFIDAFRGFTALELKLIERMLCDAEAVYVTLTMEIPGEAGNFDPFAHTKETERRLVRLAQKNNIPVSKSLNLSMGNKYNNFPKGFLRFDRPGLAALEKNLFDPAACIYEDECPEITLVTAGDIYSECEYVACMAKKLIREEGYRCRDIAIVAREIEQYDAPMRAALIKCGVNVFDDRRQPITASPLVSLVRAAFSAAAVGINTENLMRFHKSGLTELTTDELSELENYAYLWQINGSKWLREWKNHPGGYGFAMTDEDSATLEAINAVRERAVEPLVRFSKRIASADGESAARAVVVLLEACGVPERLKALAVSLKERGELAAAKEQERIWNVLMELLDSLANVVGSRTFTAPAIEKLFNIMLMTQTLGSVPQGIDEVTLGSADRIRMGCPKAVFVVGANYGVFPLTRPGTSALNDKERHLLAQRNIELPTFEESKLEEERLIAYGVFCAARERLFICAPSRDVSGAAVEQSELMTKIARLFPNCARVNVSELDGEFFVQSRKSAFYQLAREMPGNTPLKAVLFNIFENDTDYAGKLEALRRTAGRRDFRITDRNAAERLFGKSMTLSASQAEVYYKCPFEYFCKYGMRAKPKKEATIDVMQHGTIIHYALEKLLGTYKGDSLLGISKKERLKIILDIMEEYMNEFLGGREDKTPRFIRSYEGIAAVVNEIAERLVEEFRVCDFRPADFELSIGDGAEIPAYALTLEDGETLKIRGSVDRVDLAQLPDGRYFRVIDYKSGGKAFRLNDVLNGLNMQMLIYLFAVWQNSGEHYGKVEPAGVLYYPAKTFTVEADRSDSEEVILDKKKKRGRMDGIILENDDVIRAMDREISNVFIPVKYVKSHNCLSGSMISAAALNNLRDRVNGKLTEMAEALRSGCIEALPVFREKDYGKVCEYCDYKGVCFYEDGIKRRELAEVSDSDVLEVLKEEAETDE